MKITVDHAGQFRDEFFAHGRQNQFSYEALELLFDYLEENDSDYELDVVALCCEYSEMSIADIVESYDVDADDDQDNDVEAKAMEYLSRETTVIGTTSTGSVLFAQF
jgi:hypothetical protein